MGNESIENRIWDKGFRRQVDWSGSADSTRNTKAKHIGFPLTATFIVRVGTCASGKGSRGQRNESVVVGFLLPSGSPLVLVAKYTPRGQGDHGEA